jgi:hypothetical protein
MVSSLHIFQLQICVAYTSHPLMRPTCSTRLFLFECINLEKYSANNTKCEAPNYVISSIILLPPDTLSLVFFFQWLDSPLGA